MTPKGFLVPESDKSIRIMLVDDHALFREGVARLLASEQGFEVVAHCGTTDEAIAALKKQAVDLVLLDFDFGDRDCTGFMRSAAETNFKGKILLVTAGLNETQAADLVRRGVAGVFLKHNPPALLSEAIRDVMQGKAWFAQQFLQSTIAAASAAPAKTAGNPLTYREREVLYRVFEGLANKEIADRLEISESSVKAILQQLFRKTGVRTRSQLVRVALEKYRDQLDDAL
jgi:two-component system nitrate/nitrite response regulator NarL